MSGSGFILNEKGELYATVETTYGTTPDAATLVVADAVNWLTFDTKVEPDLAPTEEGSGGVTPGMEGQAPVKVGEKVLYSGSVAMREHTVSETTDDGTRPNYDLPLRAGGYLPAVYNAGARSLTYDLAVGGNCESMAYRYREWVRDGSRKLHDVQGGRHSFKIKWAAGKGTMLEVNNGKALSYNSPANVAAASFPPDIGAGGSSVMVWAGTTTALIVIGGDTYAGAIMEVNIGVDQRTEMLASEDASGYCEALNNPIRGAMDMLVYETATGLEVRDAWNEGDVFELNFTTAGPGAAGNTVGFRDAFVVESVAEEEGPGKTKALRLTCKPLWADRSAHTDVGTDPSQPYFRLTLTTA